jgi:quinol monooxygenase YgiN
MTVVRLNRIFCRAGCEAELERRLRNVAAAARVEAGCRQYDWYRQELSIDGTRYLNVSQWASLQDWEDHLRSASFRQFFEAERREPCLEGDPEHYDLTAIGEAQDD